MNEATGTKIENKKNFQRIYETTKSTLKKFSAVPGRPPIECHGMEKKKLKKFKKVPKKFEKYKEDCINKIL